MFKGGQLLELVRESSCCLGRNLSAKRSACETNACYIYFTHSTTIKAKRKEKRVKEMEHVSHRHPLILKENHVATEGDLCYGCNGKIVSCKSFVYSCVRVSITGETSTDTSTGTDNGCVNFLLHKTCAELPLRIQNPENPTEFLIRCSRRPPTTLPFLSGLGCMICGVKWEGFCYCNSDEYCFYYLCLKCAMFRFQSLENRNFDHPSHPQHSLTLIQRPSSFMCDACNVEDNTKDLSYACTKCPFWMHKSCADAPKTFQFQVHDKHPLRLSFSLPKAYQQFDQYCRLCNETLNRLNWLYYCGRCRFFAHFQCARLSQTSRRTEHEDLDSKLVHLPAADESSITLLVQQFIKAASTLNNRNNNNNSSISSATSVIKHWTHEHELQLITTNELNDCKYDDEILLTCVGCVKTIQTGDLFYSCSVCKYFLHKACAEFRGEIQHHLWPGHTLYVGKSSRPYKLFNCHGCGELYNSMFVANMNVTPYVMLHIGCATLPEMVKHEAHPHKLNQVYHSGGSRRFRPLDKLYYDRSQYCKACGKGFSSCKHRCEECDYNICGKCIMKARTIKHPWDTHPLHLIYEPGMVTEDHEHDFNCEFCSKDIDTNLWFYHCSDCDLSFHLDCSEKSCYRQYSNIKFGISNIVIKKLHPHSLTLILNKKVRRCQKCRSTQLGEPVFECAALCKAIFCSSCCVKAGGR